MTWAKHSFYFNNKASKIDISLDSLSVCLLAYYTIIIIKWIVKEYILHEEVDQDRHPSASNHAVLHQMTTPKAQVSILAMKNRRTPKKPNK